VEAQKKSLVLLKNEDQLLPLQKVSKVFVEGIKNEVASKYSNTVSNPHEADVVILKLYTPYEPREKYMLERFFHQGRLYFTTEELTKNLKIINT
jgi:beta-glucosidase